MFKLIFVVFTLCFQTNTLLFSANSVPAITPVKVTAQMKEAFSITRFPLLIRNALDKTIELRINSNNEKFHGKLLKMERNGQKIIADFKNREFSKEKLRIRSDKRKEYTVELAVNDKSNCDKDNIVLNVYEKGGDKKIADISVSKYAAKVYTEEEFCGKVYMDADIGSVLVILGESDESVDEEFESEKNKFGLPIRYIPI